MEYSNKIMTYSPMIIGVLLGLVIMITLIMYNKQFINVNTSAPSSLASLSVQEPFCNCFGMEDKTCPDLKNVTNSYRDGILTENSNLVRGGWKTIMPDDQFNAKKRPIERPWNNYIMPYDEWGKKQYM
jgi:hypothetical protein